MAIVRMQQRRDTAANWSLYNPTLRAGEFGVDTDVQKMKVGDGVTPWDELDFLLESEVAAAVAAATTAGSAAVTASAAAVEAAAAADLAGVSTDEHMAAIDADAGSEFRIQSDARLAASIDARSTSKALAINIALGGI